MNKKALTIFALSTAPGKSAIALIRVSGPDAYTSVEKISGNMPKRKNISTYNKILTRDGLTIDETITTFFKGPKSYTGEDVVEICIHGSQAVIKKAIKTLSEDESLRPAMQGEFTRRAFENNKLDLTQVEAIDDLIKAETEMQRKQAVSHLSGSFFKASKDIFNNLKKILANIEAVIDFSEDDLPQNLINNIKEQIQNIITSIEKTLADSDIGISIRDGFVVAILGKPNTGKSSFINNISGKDLAIVTNQPGTTRDLIESYLDIEGYPIKFVDTAGIRRATNIVEKIGVEKAISVSKNADINIVFIDKSEDLQKFKDIENKIFIKSKQDITKNDFNKGNYYNISSKSNYGIKNVLNIIIKKIEKKAPRESIHLSRERHISCLNSALKHLLSSQKDKNTDLFAEDIRQAIKNIASLFGGLDIEDILDIIFSDFCIGK